MNIDLLSKMVGELILDHDRVSLPGLGAFVAEMVPATFADKGYTINPPYRKLSFRSGAQSDTVLSDFYASSNNIQKEYAERAVAEFIAELKTVLFSRKIVVFPGLGRLRATKENNVFFVPDEDLDIYPEGLGLEPVSLKSHIQTPAEVSAAVSGLRAIVEPAEVETVVEEAVVEETVAEEKVVEEQMTEDPVVEEPVMEEPVVEPASAEKTKGKWITKTLIALGVIAALVVLALSAYLIAAHLAPDFIDRLLYTDEELDIIRRYTNI